MATYAAGRHPRVIVIDYLLEKRKNRKSQMIDCLMREKWKDADPRKETEAQSHKYGLKSNDREWTIFH